MRLDAIRPAHVGRDRNLRLRHVGDLMSEQHLDVRKFAQSIEDQLGGLELLALNDIGITRVVLEQRVIELRHQFAARPVPELEDRHHQSDPRHVLREPVHSE